MLLLCLLTASPLFAQAPDSALSRARALAEVGAWHEAADLFQRELARSPNDPTLLGEAIDALEACGRWREAMPLLDRLIGAGQPNARRHWQRGLYGAWSGDREGGVLHLRQAVELHPLDAEYLASLGEVLSWHPSNRVEARGLFEQALARDGRNIRARVGQANLEAWSGHGAEALQRFDTLLAEHPGHVGALTGKGATLEGLRRHREARTIFRRIRELSPEDEYVALRLARTELALGNARAAAGLVAPLADRLALDVRTVRDSARRALASSVSLHAGVTSRERQLDRQSADLELSLAPSAPLRVTLAASPGRYEDGAGSARGHSFGGGLSWRGARVGLQGSASYRDLGRLADAQWTGGATAQWQPAARLRFEAGWSRSPVEETRTSTFGQSDEGVVRAPVHAALATAAVAIEEIAGRLALKAEVLTGHYGGSGWERNGRIGAGVEATVGLRAAGPHLRIGYAFRATRFEFNADTVVATAPSQAAGYFSPDRYHIHQAVAQASHQVGARFNWALDGRLGEETVRARAGETPSRRTAMALNARIAARLTGHLDLDISYLYVDAFDAFRMHHARVGLRQFF